MSSIRSVNNATLRRFAAFLDNARAAKPARNTASKPTFPTTSAPAKNVVPVTFKRKPAIDLDFTNATAQQILAMAPTPLPATSGTLRSPIPKLFESSKPRHIHTSACKHGVPTPIQAIFPAHPAFTTTGVPCLPGF